MNFRSPVFGIVFTILFASSYVFAQDAPEIKHEMIDISFTSEQSAQLQDGIVFTGNGMEISGNGGYSIFISEGIPVPLSDIDPFLGVGVKYELEGSTLDVDIYISVSADGYQWDDFVKVEYDEDIWYEGNTYASSAMVFDKEAKYLRYRIDMHGSDAEVEILKSLSISFMSPGVTPVNMLERISGKSYDGSRQPDNPNDFPKPPVVTRTEWGCPDGQGSRWSPSYTTVTHLIVHHTATSNSANDWAAIVRMIWQWHAIDNGWGDIGYNFLIDPNGVVYEGRAGGDGARGAHFCGTNSNTMGVSMIGTYSNVMVTNDAAGSLLDLLVWKCDQISLDPLSSSYHSPSGRTLNHISGHRDGCATACPGQTLYDFLPILRTDIQNVLSNIAPAVSTQSLPNGASDVLAYRPITLTFSMQMDTVLFESAVTVTPAVDYTLEWQDEFTVSIQPSPFWDFSTSYTLRIDSSAKNIYGATLDGDGNGEPGGDFVLNFSTTAPDNNAPEITRVYPSVEGVSVKTGIAVVLNEYVENGEDKIVLFDAQNNQIPVTEVELTQRGVKSILTCKPEDDLLPEADYTLKILPGISDPFGNAIESEKLYSFRTETGSFTKGVMIDKFSSLAPWIQPVDNPASRLIDTLATSLYLSFANIISGPTASCLNYAFTNNNGGFVKTERIEAVDIGNLTGVWVYGDFSYNMLEFIFLNPEEYRIDAALLDFYGWRFIYFDASDIPGSQKQFLGLGVRQLTTGDKSGIMYFDDLQKDALTDADSDKMLPDQYALEQNFPNPFNPVTTIEYQIPEAGVVSLKIYNTLGEKVATLSNDFTPTGSYSVRFDAADLPSGIYYYRLQAGDFVQTKKMLLLK